MIRAGDNIVWKGEGFTFSVLSAILSWKDKTWRSRSWRGWHMGYVVNVLDTGEIVTSQAVNEQEGVCAITYPNLAAMGNCKIYHWLDNPDQTKIEQFASEHNGDKYDIPAYFFTFISYLFNWHFAVFTKKEDCWDNVC